MFCPKCGTENPDANKYCRACRESLLVFAQAMKRRLPVMIVSKFDAALEQSNERFRRDSILWMTVSIGMLILAAVDFTWRPTSSKVGFDLFVAAIGLITSGWSYLAYKRSVIRNGGIESGELASGGETPASQLQILFCPACGVKVVESLKHCRSCGANLHPIRSAVRPSRWQMMLNSLLDKYIGFQSNKLTIHKNARQMMILPFTYLALGILDIYKDRNPTWLLFSFMFFVIVLWDRAASRRWFPKEEKGNDEPMTDGTNPLIVPTTNELALLSTPVTSPMSITEETTRHLEPVIVQSQEEVETRKL